MILTPLQKLPNNAGDLGKIIVASGFEWLSKCKKSPNLVTLKEMKNQNRTSSNLYAKPRVSLTGPNCDHFV